MIHSHHYLCKKASAPSIADAMPYDAMEKIRLAPQYGQFLLQRAATIGCAIRYS